MATDVKEERIKRNTLMAELMKPMDEIMRQRIQKGREQLQAELICGKTGLTAEQLAQRKRVLEILNA